MAANINIGSGSLASDGKTATFPISGGTGTGYAITDTTGLKLRKTNAGGLIYPISSVSVSGTTLTVNGSFPFSGSDTVVFDIATNSNLTDSGANTPTGQTGVAVTNNSTKTVTTFASTNAAIKQSGYWTLTAGTRNWINPSNGSRLDFGVTGTDVALVCFPQITQPYEVAINGGSYSSPSTNAGGNWSVLPLATGQADGTPYSVTVKYNNSNSPFVDTGTGATTGGTLLVAGSSPALSNPSGSWGTPFWIDSTPYTTYGAVDGVISTIAYGAHNAYKLIVGNVVRFNSASSFVAIWIDPVSAGNVELYQDGVAIASLALSGTSVYDRYVLATGLDTSGTHLYEIIPYAPPQISASTGFITYVELDSLATSAVAVRGGDAFYGDSISDNWAVTDARQGDQFLVGRAVGRTGMPFGYPSQNVSTFLRDNTANIPTTVTRVWCRGGHNDALNSVTIGAVGTPGTFTGDYYTMLSNIRSRIGASKWIICEPIFPTSAYTTTVRNNYNTALATAVNTYISNTSDAFVLLLPSTDNWISASPSGAGDDTSDGTHPFAQGYTKIANREIPVAWGYGNTGTGYTISGPASGTVGQASGAFTVTIASGATFTGDQTVTLSDGGNGGTFNVTAGGGSVSGNNTGNPTVTPAANATNFTYTYTPASAGAKSLSGTNAQAWQNPSASTYTAAAGGTISASPSTINKSQTTLVTITGTGTNFTSVGQFSISGGTGASINAGLSSINSTTSATLSINAGSQAGANLLTITDTGDGSTTCTLSVQDLTAPTSPTGLSAGSISQTGFTVNWSAATDPDDLPSSLTYKVFLNGTLYGTTSAGVTSMTVTGRTANTLYNVTVEAVDPSSNASLPSSSLPVTTLPYTLSASPAVVQPGGSGAFSLLGGGTSWTAGSPGSPIFTIAKTPTNDASIVSQSVTDGTHATLNLNYGATKGVIVVTDPSTGAKAGISVGVGGIGVLILDLMAGGGLGLSGGR